MNQGVITFVSGDTVITAHVEDVKQNYAYWSIPYISENLAAVGWAEYNGEIYNFMFLYAEGGIWIILSTSSYNAEWAAETVWLTNRAYQVLLGSQWVPDSSEFYFDPKEIHTVE